MKLLSFVLSLGLLAAAARAQTIPPNATAAEAASVIKKNPDWKEKIGAVDINYDQQVAIAPGEFRSIKQLGDAVKELDGVKANNAQLQQANQFWQIVADRNAQALMVVNQQTELANKNAEVARLNAELAKAQKEIDSLKAELKAARDGAKK